MTKVTEENPSNVNATTSLLTVVRAWCLEWLAGWDRFWFKPRTCETLAALRIATGAMLLYTHIVLASDLMAFLGPDAWVNHSVAQALHDGSYGVDDAAWSYLWYVESPSLLWAHQIFAIVVSACMMLGLASRISVPLSLFLQLMFVHRLTGALYGLDQITTMLVMYLSFAPSGSVYSLDARLRKQRSWPATRWWNFMLPTAGAKSSANVITRLIQLHVCVIYLFGGLWKARGEMWWDGTAMWFAAANYEYQSNDLTWLSRFPILFAALTHLTIFWETFYPALVWPRLTRPFVLAMAVAVHGGIATFLGMITFGVMMIVANAVFVEPEYVRAIVSRFARGKPD